MIKLDWIKNLFRYRNRAVIEDKEEWVQCFFNLNFNYLSERGQCKFANGFCWVKLLGDDCDYVRDILGSIEVFDSNDMYNVNVISLTPFHEGVFVSRAKTAS